MFNIAFAGTSFFSIPFFRKLYDASQFNVKFVLTKNIEENRYQDTLLEYIHRELPEKNIPIHTPRSMEEVDPKVFEEVDAVVVVAYGFRITPQLLDATKWVNVHGSYLPLYRGASPIQYTVMNQGKGAGLSLIKMSRGIDTGDIINRFTTCDRSEPGEICVVYDKNDTYTSMANKLMEIGPDWVVDNLTKYLEGKITPFPQGRGSKDTIAPSIRESDRMINWFDTAEKVKSYINALAEVPCCVVTVGPYKVKCLSAIALSSDDMEEPAALLSTKKLIIKCSYGCVRITRVIPMSGKPMSDEDFCRGRDLTKIEYVK